MGSSWDLAPDFKKGKLRPQRGDPARAHIAKTGWNWDLNPHLLVRQAKRLGTGLMLCFLPWVPTSQVTKNQEASWRKQYLN